FEVGRNVATAPGKIVFQNDLVQLIQYTPSTETVQERPLLIVPPWINKFYILDLTAPKSFIRYMVGKGFTVFVLSWVNPDERLAHGHRVQSIAAEGPDLALHRQQLHAGQEAVPVRSPVLEPGFDADDAGQPQFLSARVLPREQTGPRADDDRRRQARPRQGQA